MLAHFPERMPEFPEVEAARQALDEVVGRSRVEKAGPAHVATLKTFDPPLAALEGLRLAGARRRGKNLLFPTEDGGLVLHVHLMSAGRIRFLEPGAKGPKDPRLPARPRGRRTARPHGGRPEEARPRRRLPTRRDRGRARPPRPRGRRDRRRAARRDPAGGGTPPASVPARPARPRRDRPGLVERDPEPRSPLAVRAHDGARGRGRRAARRDHQGHAGRGPRAAPPGRGRRQGLPRAQPARRAVPELRDADRPRRLRGAHDLLLPELPDGRADPEGPPAVAAAQIARRTTASSATTTPGSKCVPAQLVISASASSAERAGRYDRSVVIAL